MAIHWQIKFKAIRSGTDYTVNIYDNNYSGNTPLQLKGGAQPFTTQEDNNEDMFTPVRTQTGYFRIVDDGWLADGVTAFNWKTLLPTTDTDRPLTLTAGGVTLWQGFMQSQDFGSKLYGNPQEREFPIHCPLTVTEGTDINYTQKEIQNFAYLLKQIIDSIPATCRPTSVKVQGGADAQAWLLKRIDWQNFCETDNDGNLTARFNMFQCLEDICRFWGWTARIHRQTLYLTCVDDSAETTWLTMTHDWTSSGQNDQLSLMASGTAAGTTNGAFTSLELSGDIFANTDNDDYLQRGYNRATVTANTNRGDDNVINVFNDQTIKTMQNLGTQSPPIHSVIYTNDLLTVNQPFLKVSCREGYASLNIGYFGYAWDAAYANVIRIKKTGGYNVTPYVEIEMPYEHCFNDGFLRMYGQTYRFNEEYLDPYQEYAIGRSYMYARIAIGKDKEHAKWWNGTTWQDSPTYCRISIGNKANNLDNNKNEFFFETTQQLSTDDDASNILPVSGMQGKLFIDLLGTDNTRVELIDGERSFELKDFSIEFSRNPGVVLHGTANYSTNVEDIDRPTNLVYKASNQNNVRMEWNADCIYATENNCKFSYGELINPDGSFVTTVPYNGSNQRPEQHHANRVTNYWSSAKRRLKSELRSSITVSGTVIRDISPQYKVTLDSTTCHPIAISHEWRDDITIFTLLQI